jgi:hypothetical protein
VYSLWKASMVKMDLIVSIVELRDCLFEGPGVGLGFGARVGGGGGRGRRGAERRGVGRVGDGNKGRLVSGYVSVAELDGRFGRREDVVGTEGSQ